jgi:hypothetical protein
MFSGVTPERRDTDQICLDQHEPYGRNLAIPCYDVDSALTVFTDLSRVRGTLRYIPNPQRTRCLSRSVHIKVSALVPSRESRSGLAAKIIPIHQIPHILFGSIEEEPVFIFFPRMFRPDNPSDSIQLTDSQYAALYDSVTYPALSSLGDDIRHHLPPAFTNVMNDAMARQAEVSASAAARGAPVEISIGPRSIAQFWESVRDTLSAAGRSSADPLWEFGTPIFLYDCSGTKLEYRDGASLNSTLGVFWDSHSRRIDKVPANAADGMTPQQYVDIAAEFMPESTATGPRTALLARRCCQNNTLRFLFGSDPSAALGIGQAGEDDAPPSSPVLGTAAASPPPSSPPDDVRGTAGLRPRLRCRPQGTTVEYNLFTLRDTVSITYEPKFRQGAHALGLAYFQSYSVTKRMFDGSSGTLPFSNTRLWCLPYGDAQWAPIAAQGKLTKGFDRHALREAFLRSIQRVDAAIGNVRGTHFGHRIEFRVSARLADRIQVAEAQYCAELYAVSSYRPVVGIREPEPSTREADGGAPGQRERGLRGADRDRNRDDLRLRTRIASIFSFDDIRQVASTWTEPDANAFFFIPQPDLQGFLRGNVHKHLLAMDSICAIYHSANPTSFVPQPTITLFSLLLYSLRHFVSCLPPRSRYLVNNAVAHGGHPGLGFEDTMEKRGFAFWPADLVDWGTFTLQRELAERFTVPEIRHLYRSKPVQKFCLDQAFLDRLLGLYDTPGMDDVQCRLLHEVVVHFLLRCYRQQVIQKLFPRALSIPALRAHLQHDTLPFTIQHLTAAISRHDQRSVSITKGNKAMLLDARPFFSWLWTREDTAFRRTKMDSLPFRVFFAAAMDRISRSVNPCLVASDLQDLLYCRFYEQHSAVPYPDSNGSLAATVKHTRARSLCTWSLSPAKFSHTAPGIRFFRGVSPSGGGDPTESAVPLFAPRVIQRLSSFEDVEDRLRSASSGPISFQAAEACISRESYPPPPLDVL